MQYSEEVQERLLTQGIRSEIDSSPSTLRCKIRQAEIQKIPYMQICGKLEAKMKKVALRRHGSGNIGLLTIRELLRTLNEGDREQHGLRL